VKIPRAARALQSIPPPLKRQEIAMSLVPGFPDRVHYINHEKCEAAFVQGGRVIEDLTVIAIPAKTPHQLKDTSKSGSVCYYAVNYQT
jgi:hypothetical protein